jgi:hypothetical protein
MSDTILGFGLVCIAAAIIGGGLSAAGTKIPLINSIPRQILLGAFGALLVVGAKWTDVRPILFPPRFESLTDGPTNLAKGDFRKTPISLDAPGLVEVSMVALTPQTTQPRISICPAKVNGECPWRQLSAADSFSAETPAGPATVTVLNYPENPPITYTLRIKYAADSWRPARWLVVLVAGLTILGVAFGMWRKWDKKNGDSIDDLQRDILRLMWNVQGGTMPFAQVAALIGAHPNLVSIAGQGLQERGLIAYNSYTPDSLVQLLPDGRIFAVSHQLTDATAILKRAANRAKDGDPDYMISVVNPGEFTVTARSERAQARAQRGLGRCRALVFKGRDPDLLEFVRAAEESGFTVSGKELLSP